MTVWLDEVVYEAMQEGCDVCLAPADHGFHIVIDGEVVTDNPSGWGLPWETLTAEIRNEGDSR